ncbi:MAG: ABC transporter substrate-binding protein [Deltaproteobacteria bacterium]|nr:ABC transporter substrate-binding protein [Deltaproteobacteria bacterium]
MRKYLVLIFASIIMTMTLVTPARAEAKEVRVGLLYPISGPIASIGRLCVQGHQFAVDKINAEGGIKSLGGAKIKLIIADTEGKADVGMAEAEKLIKQEKVVAIFGAYQSGVTFPTSQVAEKYKTPFLIAQAVADPITERGFKYIFRTQFKASWNAVYTLDILKWLGEKYGPMAKTVALLYENTLWGQSTAKMWKRKCPDYAFKIVGDFPYSKTATDLSSTISKLKGKKPDAVLQISYLTDAILVTKTMYELDFNCMARIPSGGGHSDPRFIEAVGNLGENIIVNHMFHPSLKGPGTKVQDVNEAYKAKYKDDMDDYSASSYSITFVLKDALERAGSTNGEKLRDAIATTDIGINNSPSIYPYALKFDKTGQDPVATGIATQYQNGKLVMIYPEEYASAKPIYPMPSWKERGLR